MGDVASGVFALLGAGVGGFASWFGTVTDSKHRRAEAARERLGKLAETRRVLYSTLVERSDVVIDAARDVLSYEDPEDVPEESEDRYAAAWAAFVEARASVEIVGPADAGVAATDLYKCVADVCNQADAWYFGHQPWTTDGDAAREKLLAERIKSRERFVETTQAIVAAGDGP